MLVSSIGYFNNRNNAIKVHSANSRITRTDNAGFGHVQNDVPNVEKNVFLTLSESFKKLFSHEKADKKKETVSVVV